MPGSISVVLPTFNRAAGLRANLDSVLAMAGVDEVVVVDDGSTDDTWPWLQARSDDRLRPVRQPANRGSPAARNTGAQHARGDWVVFAEDDCRFPDRKSVV